MTFLDVGIRGWTMLVVVFDILVEKHIIFAEEDGMIRLTMCKVLVLNLMERELVLRNFLYFSWSNLITKVSMVASKAMLPDCSTNSSMIVEWLPNIVTNLFRSLETS